MNQRELGRLSDDEAEALYLELCEILARLKLRLFRAALDNRHTLDAAKSRALTARQAHSLVGMSRGWLYEHARELPFTIWVNGRPRFDEAGLLAWKRKKLNG